MDDLIGNNNEKSAEQVKTKKMMKMIGIILVILLIICIALIGVMYYIQTTQLKVTIDGKSNKNLEKILLIQDNEIYVPIRKFAEYVGYQSYSGDYKQYAEDTTKCYVQCANEVASFTLNSEKIYKLLVTGNDYEYFTINEPVKMINGELYTTMEGAEVAFNISFGYSKEQNKITIFTLPYLVTYYTNQFQNSAVADKDADFSNQKALLYNMIVVKNADNAYGVSGLDGKEILGTKYANIKFIESTKEFIVRTAEGKMGIMSYDSTTKISPEYDDIKQIDKNAGLYLVTNNKKQGVINNNGNIVVYLEYDQIGIDSSKYISNNIKNQYLLYDNCIPVKRNNLWGIFDKTGKKVLEVEYEDLGCNVGSGNSSDKTANNIILIPDYEGIVVKKQGLYGIFDSSGKELIPVALKSVYSITSGGQETYYMIYNEQVINVIDYIKKNVIKDPVDNAIGTNDEQNSNNTTQNGNNVNEQTNNQNTTKVNNTDTSNQITVPNDTNNSQTNSQNNTIQSNTNEAQ